MFILTLIVNKNSNDILTILHSSTPMHRVPSKYKQSKLSTTSYPWWPVFFSCFLPHLFHHTFTQISSGKCLATIFYLRCSQYIPWGLSFSSPPPFIIRQGIHFEYNCSFWCYFLYDFFVVYSFSAWNFHYRSIEARLSCIVFSLFVWRWFSIHWYIRGRV